MFKSIFTKYVTAMMCIVVVSFIVLASIVSTMLVDYYTDTSEEALSNVAVTTKGFLEDRLNQIKGMDLPEYLKEAEGEIKAYLSAVRKMNGDIVVFVTDKNGTAQISSGFSETAPDGQTLSAALFEKVSADGYHGSGDLDGLLPGRYAIVGVPIRDAYEKVVGTVFACSTSETLNQLLGTTVRAVILTCLWVLLAVLVAVYFISDRIVGPLKNMAKAAKAFAVGKFDIRVPVRGNDETAELAHAFNQMAASLADLEEMRSSFLSNVSHDLRTPMTTISGFIDGLLDGTIPPEKHEHYLRVIGDEVRRLSRLVAALLDVSRIQAGERKFTPTAFDICEMARVILISFEQKIDRKRLEVSFEVEAENMYAWADKDAVYQILYNICDNAVKFSAEGGLYRIRITEKDRRLYVSVYDEGQGLRPEELPHVFDRFYKTDKSRGLDKTGVGLGLYICKAILDAHNEEIFVKSKYGEYCEFTFTLKKATDAQVKKAFERQLPEESTADAGNHP